MTFARGIHFFMAGLHTAFSSDVRLFVVFPAIMSLLVITGGLTLAFSYVTDLSNYLTNALPSWLGFLEWILKPLLYLTGLLIGAWSFGFLATILGSPLLGELSLRIDKLIDSTPWWRQISPALLRELRKLRYHLPRLLLLVLVSVIPVVNAFAPLFWLGFGAWMMAVQFCDYTTENRHQDFNDTLAVLGRNRAGALGFGICVTAAMSVPVLNFIVAPVAVAGGTLLMGELRHS